MEIIKELKSVANPEAVQGMARFGINPKNTLGVSIPVLRDLAKRTGKDHGLALELWDSSIHEARILAALIDDPAKVTEQQMESWVKELDSWDICDQVCSNLFDRTAFAFQKAAEWSKREEEFVKRAGFVLMAALSVHNKKAEDEQFSSFFPLIKAAATDDRNFVKKAVNWALRQIGKRNLALNRKAIEMAGEIKELNSIAARWIASDAIRELKSEAVRHRLKSPRVKSPDSRRGREQVKEKTVENDKQEYLSLDEYIDSFPKHIQEKLDEMRNVIKELAPEAQERISYRMPAFFLNGNLVYFAGYSKHIGFYPGARAIDSFKSELLKYKFAVGSVQFPIEEPLPLELIKKMVNFRIQENLKKKHRGKGNKYSL